MNRIFALLLAVLLTFSLLPVDASADFLPCFDKIDVGQQEYFTDTQSRTSGFSKNYTLTGDGPSDMVAIALAQEGRTGSQIGYTEDWCGNFVSDCAILANQTSAIPQNGLVSNLYSAILAAGGKVTTNYPKPGDICIINWNGGTSMQHAEIVYAVSGTTVYTIGGNSGSGSTLYTRYVRKHAPLSSKYILYILRPAYKVNQYTVKFDPNGGSGAPAAQTKVHGTDLTLSSVVPTRFGYTFLGWATSATATTAAYQPGGKFKTDANTTLYAVWEPYTYTISYDANGGKGEPADQTKEHDVPLKLSTAKPTRDGYTFQGWDIEKTATEALHQPGATINYNANTTMYAVWKANTYAISYDANGGTGAPANQIKTHGVTLTLSKTVPTRPGYTFMGWATSATAAKAAYQPGGSFTTNAKTTLYAVWQANTYVVRYDANGGEGAPETQSKTHDVPLVLSTTVPTRTGYTFRGWGLSADGTAVYQPGEAFTKEADTTLYAVWEAHTYTVRYDANGGTGAPGSQVKTHDVPLTLSTTVPTRFGYTFQGWALSADGTAAYQPGGAFTKDADTTLYAVWKPLTYTITYDANRGLGEPANQTKTHDVPLTLSTDVPIRTGYSFLGWALSADGTAVYQPGDTFTTEANTTLYAVWQADTYTITYHANRGANAPASQVKTYGAPLRLTTDKPTRTGYTFRGWALSADGAAVYQPGDLFRTNADTTLYAVWQADTYTIRFNANGGTGAPASQVKTYGTPLRLTTDKPARTGYTFQGWALSADGAVAYQPGDLFKSNADTTLYAVWKVNTYTVTFDANGGTNAPASQVKTYGAPLRLTTDKPTRFGYSFLGWATAPDAAEAAYQPGSLFAVNADTTLYALWHTDCVDLGTCGADVNWALDDAGTLTIAGSGPMKNYSYKSEMPWYGWMDQIRSVVIEPGVTAIGDYAFYGMAVDSVSIPDTVTAIGSYAFKNAAALKTVVLPAKLTKLGESAFYGCTGLTAVEIPASLWTVQDYTFKNCTALAEVTFHEGNLQKISDGAFYNTALTEVVLPDCLDILDVYTFKNCARLERVTLGSGLTEIREAVFYGTALSEITIPEGVARIRPYAFRRCKSLVSVDLPASLTTVEEAAFYDCAALESLALPDGMKTIGSYAFRNCTGLREISFGSGLETIGECSFYGCTGLTDLAIPDSVTAIRAYAFKNCTGLTAVDLGSGVTSLGEGAFQICTGLKNLIFPGSVATIGDYCFSGSWNLWELTFEGDAPAIGTGAFRDLEAMAYYPADNATWTADVMLNYGGEITWKAN